MFAWFSIAAACDEPLKLSDVVSLTSAFERAYFDRDIDRVRTNAALLEHDLPCLREPLLAPDAAGIHRVFGLLAFVSDDRRRAVGALEAARTLDPTYELPLALAAEGHPLRTLFLGIEPGEPPLVHELPPPETGWIQIDGRRHARRPNTRASIVQRFDATGLVVQTVYLEADDPDPVYPIPSLRRPIGLRVAGGAFSAPGSSGTDAFALTELGASVPAGPLDLGFGLLLGFWPEAKDGAPGMAMVPGVSVGARLPLGPAERVRPRLGVSGLLLFNDERLVTPGVRGGLGVEVPLSEGARFTADGAGGLVADHLESAPTPWLDLTVGLELAL